MSSDVVFQATELNLRLENRKKRKTDFNEMKKLYQYQEEATVIMNIGKEDEKLNTSELSTLLKWKLSGKGFSQFKNKKEKLEEWKRIKSQEIALVENPGEYVEDVSEMNIPSIEETELARKRADSVTDARMVVLGNMSSSEIQEMLSTKIQYETQTPVVYDLDEID